MVLKSPNVKKGITLISLTRNIFNKLIPATLHGRFAEYPFTVAAKQKFPSTQ